MNAHQQVRATWGDISSHPHPRRSPLDYQCAQPIKNKVRNSDGSSRDFVTTHWQIYTEPFFRDLELGSRISVGLGRPQLLSIHASVG